MSHLGALAGLRAGLVAEALQVEQVLRVHAAALQDVQDAARSCQSQHALPTFGTVSGLAGVARTIP